MARSTRFLHAVSAIPAFTAGSVLALTLAMLAPGRVAFATVMLPLSIERLSESADVIVRGRVVNDFSAWDEAQRTIRTFSELEVLETVFAESGRVGPSFVVRSLGGEVGEVGMHVSGTPRFFLGEEVLLFLRRAPERSGPEDYQVVGMSQGKYRIEQEEKGRLVAVADARGLAFMRPGQRTVQHAASEEERPSRIAYSDLKARVLRAVATRADVQGSGAAESPLRRAKGDATGPAAAPPAETEPPRSLTP